MQTKLKIPLVIASDDDYEYCRKLYHKMGRTFYIATRLTPKKYHKRIDAIYGFARLADEWVDNPGDMPFGQIEQRLTEYQSELVKACKGNISHFPTIRAFSEVVMETGMSLEEPILFLETMRSDLYKARYETYEDLCHYMRGSASSIGLMLCHIFEPESNEQIKDAAITIGLNLQYTNFLRNIKEDAERGRIYLPLEDLEQFGVTEASILESHYTDQFKELMKFECNRNKRIHGYTMKHLQDLPIDLQKPAKTASYLYSFYLTEIEKQNYHVFKKRPSISDFKRLIGKIKVNLGMI